MAEGAPDASKGLRGLIPSDEVTRHLVNLPLCTEAGYIRIRLGLGLGWARVGLERIRNGPSVGGSFAATWAHRNASESRGASNGRTSGQLPTQRALDSPVYGLSSAPVAVGHAMALRLSTERVTGTVWRQWPQLYPQRTGRCKPWLPYSLCLLYPGIPDIIEVKIETKAKIVVPYHSRYSWELTQLSRRT